MPIDPGLRLLQLVSPSLPVGAYAYSHGLEAAVELGWVHDMKTAHDWIGGLLLDHQARLDAPLLLRLHAAASAADLDAVEELNAELNALRETAELRQEDAQLGQALLKLLANIQPDTQLPAAANFATAFALAAAGWQITAVEALRGYLWHYCESQVQASIKLVPLGQTDGQRLLGSLMAQIDEAVSVAKSLADEDIGSLCPALAMVSAGHETQYSRLFRS